MDWWQIVCAIGVPALGIIAGLWKGWRKALTLLKESSEATVAFGTMGLALHKALVDPTVTEEEKQEIIAAAQKVGKELSEAAVAATELFSKKT